MSTHECPVIKVKLEKHPGADTLSLVHIYGYTCVVRTQDWKDGDIAVYIPPDFVCPDTEQFAFLGDKKRIKCKKLRGIVSEGLLIKAPQESKPGDNVRDQLGIKRYNPELSRWGNTGGEDEIPPKLSAPYYDIENYKRYRHLITSGENVVITEKLNGCNARFVYHDGRMRCGSHGHWKRESEKNLWWKALSQNIWIENWCKAHEDHIVYGECFGQVGGWRYGSESGQIKLAIFDIRYDGRWLEYDYARQISDDCIWVPELYKGPFDEETALRMAEEDSSIKDTNTIREGVVVTAIPEKISPEIGRIKLKIVSNRYLSS